LNRILASLTRSAGKRGVAYDLPPEGAAPLRRAIARRLFDAGASLSADDIVTTSGATEALMLCLRAVTQPGDIVAVESPTFFGVLATLEDLHLRAIEIPTEPRDGLDLDALERILKRRRVTACVAMPNFNNPLGSLMPDENKRRLAELLSKREIPLIEDDVFGELPFGAERPRVVRSFDRNGFTLLCGSFSKTLAPGYRVGWVAPGPRYQETIKELKLTSTLSAATLPQLAVAEFLATGGYDHHLRSLRQKFAAQVNRMSTAIAAAFPPATKITRPGGGFVLWIQLPERVCALKLDDMALAAGVSIAPGPMFSATHGFGNFIRISCCHPWSLKMDHAIGALASLVKHLS
jgi:DNA-binding transcriptional MocR family regulator